MIYKTPSGTVYPLYKSMLAQPHLLIAGATGSGKSVAVNGLIYTALYSPPGRQQGGKEFILIDPKRVELVDYKELPHCIAYASEQEQFPAVFNRAVDIVNARYKLMQRERLKKYPGSDIYLIVDEFADLMTTQRRTLAPIIQRLAQIGRAAGVHLVIGTQTPISKVLPTEIKVNFDSRLALRTRSAQDSRNITGVAGCETLPRYGYGYYMTPEESSLQPVPYIPDDELRRRVEWWTAQRPKKWKLFNIGA